MSSLTFLVNDLVWDSLKIPVIVIAALAPVLVAILVIRYQKKIKGLQAKHQSDQKIFEKRVEIYGRMGPKLYDLYCFFCYNGNWKEITPAEVMRIKKELDRDMHTHASLFTDEIAHNYTRFAQLCFVAHSGWEHEEKIKSHYELRKDNNPVWKEDWIAYFDTNNVLDAITMKQRYDELIASFKRDLSPL